MWPAPSPAEEEAGGRGHGGLAESGGGLRGFGACDGRTTGR